MDRSRAGVRARRRERAHHFYGEVLGLERNPSSPGVIAFDVDETLLDLGALDDVFARLSPRPAWIAGTPASQPAAAARPAVRTTS
jgi:catechol-2,3-dioxygenase